MHHGFDCFSKKHEQEEQKHHWLGVRGTSPKSFQNLKEEELVILLENMIA